MRVVNRLNGFKTRQRKYVQTEQKSSFTDENFEIKQILYCQSCEKNSDFDRLSFNFSRNENDNDIE